MFYTFLGLIADSLDIILTLVNKPQRSIIVSKFWHVASASAHLAVCMCLQISDVNQPSNEEILKLIKNAPKLPDSNVVKLTPDYVGVQWCLLLELGTRFIRHPILGISANLLHLIK
jgi:hypothetical protein